MPRVIQIEKNIQFLRESMEYDINQLAEIIDVDPIDLFYFEKEAQIDSSNISPILIRICNYFMVPFGDLVHEDLRTFYDQQLFSELKSEWKGEFLIDRSAFYQGIYNCMDVKKPENLNLADPNDRRAMDKLMQKMMCNTMHMELIEQNRYPGK